MHVSSLVLCDAASVREGLLSVLGAGITVIRRPSYPAPLASDIGVVVSHTTSDKAFNLSLAIRKQGDPAVVAEIVIDGQVEPDPKAPPGVPASSSFPLDARGIGVPSAGVYTITATLRGGKGLTISFTAVDENGVYS